MIRLLGLALALATPQTSTQAMAAQLDALIQGQAALPSLAEVQSQAEAAMGLGTDAEMQQWASRARYRGLLPQLDLRFGSQRDVLVRDTIEGLDWARNGQGLGINVAAKWGLGALLFADQEPRIQQERLRRSAALRLARERVTELYFERIEVELRIREAASAEDLLLAAQLDGQLMALTGGRYQVRGEK